MSKTIVIIGATGNQVTEQKEHPGSSIARVFLQKPGFKVRGVTRDPAKPASQALKKHGVELVQGDVDDVESLKIAVRGADIIFGNTAYSNESVKPGTQQKCYELELQQGKNVADAVATVADGLEMFIWSSLSAATKWSKGRYDKVYHFDSKAHVVDYINEQHPAVAQKMSILQMGLFVNNWRWGAPSVPWHKQPDGSMKLRIPGQGDTPVPFVVPDDAGHYVYALTQLPIGTNLLAFGGMVTWTEYVKLWTKATGVPAVLEKVTVEEHAKLVPGGFGEEMAHMYGYMVDFGYHGGDPSVTFTSDIKVEIPITTLEEYLAREDWSPLLNGEAIDRT
ncbi:hypothetical protein LTR56_007878 [Elasticomyces elasticus]|nr:hypothetical protein LTR56_007878 [Elasticomyces elasticus]KAK3667927.1 hypothetical protein LTR22_001372 [Elasticomyces elasticus]KAK5745851.1 hypothetical protein LTS12_022958 [Elasticomyces elasticus]